MYPLLRRALAAVFAFSLTILMFQGLAVGSATQASAATTDSDVPPVIDTPADAVTADGLPTAQINGVAWDQVIVGNTVYVAGEFTSARPAGAAKGSSESPRNNLMSYNLKTGVMTSWAPNVNGRIRVITASPDGSRIYIGGSFTQVDGKIRSRIAAFDTATGALVDDFAPLAGSDVFGIAATNNVVYFGGWFTTVNSIARSRLAAVNAGDGSLTGWAPSADFTVWALGLTENADRVVVAGAFQTLNGAPATSLGSLSATDGTSYPFAANQVIHNYGNTAAMMSMKVTGGKVYSTGYWYGGTGNFEGAVIADPYDGTILNLANCLGDTYDTATRDGLMYMVSHHHQCTDIGGFTETVPRTWQHTDAVTIEATGKVQPNTYGYPNFAGNPAGSYVNWAPTMQVGAASGSDQAGWTVESSGDYLVVGGEFPTVNGVPQQGLVRFTTRANGAPKKVGPSAPASSITPTLRNIAPTSTRLSWKSDFDRDGMDLTYNVQRRVKGTTPITTVDSLSGQSTFWIRPSLQTVDSTVVSGTTYEYRLYVVDADGNGRYTPWVTITAGTNVPAASAYSDQVFADGAQNYWRFNDPAGSTTVADWAGANDLTAPANGLNLGAAGAVAGSPDTAGSFTGATMATAIGTQATSGPDTFTAELWFRTTTNSGGKLLGFGDGTTAGSGSYDRHVYMRNDGRLSYGVYNNGTYILTSPRSYNDGEWHQVVVSLSGEGMSLFVDGVRLGRRAQPTTGQSYTGRWHIGGDNLSGWDGSPSSYYFNGDIDDVSIYSSVLTRDQIRDHFVKSGRTFNAPPAPADAYGQAVTAADPTLYWRLGEAQSANTAADSTGNGFTGTYLNGPLRGVASDVVSTDTAVQFDGDNDFVASDSSFDNPTVFTLEAWFKTTSTSGGKIIGFGNAKAGNSTSYDRHIYMNAAGQLRFGAYTGSSEIAGSTESFNDGAWHQAVASLGPDGMKLYVDGVLVGQNGNTGAQNYSGYWRVGGDSTWEGANYFKGTIDEVAVYDQVLSAATVADHYQKSGAAVNLPPTVSLQVTPNGLSPAFNAIAADVDGSIASYAWDFGDGETSTEQSPEHTYAAAGSYQVNVTVTDNDGATTSAQQTIKVRAAKAVPSDAYGKAVSNDDPLLYWRLDETSGNVAADTTAGLYDGTYQGDIGHDAGSAVLNAQGSAVVGQGGFVSSDQLFDNPTTFSVEAWFNTQQPSGRIIGFGSSRDGTSANYDRQAYLDGSGNIVFGTWAGMENTVTTTGVNYADGHWHHVVGTFSAAGVTLYVDGEQKAHRADNGVQAYSGYWRVGNDSYWGSGDFVGSIDDAAVYDRALTATQVAGHYQAGVSGDNHAPTASFQATATNLSVAFDGTASADVDGDSLTYAWDFGDGGTSTEKSPEHTYGSAGTYQVTLTVTDTHGATDATTQSITVAPANGAPSAEFSVDVDGLKVSVDGSGSSDPDGDALSYAWDFGGEGSGSGAVTSHTFAGAGSYQVKLTVTDAHGATDVATKSVTVSAPGGSDTARDDFERTVSSGWGSAQVGGAWTVNSASTMSVNGSAGLARFTSSGSTRSADLKSVSASDVSIRTDLSLDKEPAGGHYYHRVVARVSGSSYYMLTMRLESSGAARLYVSKVVSGSEQVLKTTVLSGFDYVAGEKLELRFDVSGDSSVALSGKVWRSSDSEPAAAMVSATDSSSTLDEGFVGLKMYTGGGLSSLPLTATVTNYEVEEA